MFIDKDLKRFNPYANHIVNDVMYNGNILEFPDVVAELGIVEIADPVAPDDYSQETYYKAETDTPPYVVYTKKDVDQLAAVRWSKIKAKRDNITENGGCPVDDKWFHSDSKSKQQQIALVMLGANIPNGLQWKTMDGSFVTMTQTLASQIFAAQVMREQVLFAHAESLRLDPDADITDGWPATFRS